MQRSMDQGKFWKTRTSAVQGQQNFENLDRNTGINEVDTLKFNFLSAQRIFMLLIFKIILWFATTSMLWLN